jgi:hypothetical protein
MHIPYNRDMHQDYIKLGKIVVGEARYLLNFSQ